MPVLSQFYGIIIKMYFQRSEHNPPHFHIVYGDYEAECSILTGRIIAGTIPVRAKRLVCRWMSIHRDELLEIWNTQQFHKIAPLE